MIAFAVILLAGCRIHRPTEAGRFLTGSSIPLRRGTFDGIESARAPQAGDSGSLRIGCRASNNDLSS
jgi:hypothetical protein